MLKWNKELSQRKTLKKENSFERKFSKKKPEKKTKEKTWLKLKGQVNSDKWIITGE